MIQAEKSDIIRRVCVALLDGEHARAGDIARGEYPFVAHTRLPILTDASTVTTFQPASAQTPLARSRRTYTKFDLCGQFVRDGFIDRYSGERLIFPPVFRLLSTLLADAFPTHPNWKLSASHIVYWELFATLDHIRPIAAGGADAAENWATTSMLRNMAKSDSTLGAMGWTLHPPGDMRQWDGLFGWFNDYVARYPQHVRDAHVRQWWNAARRSTANVA